MSTLEVGMLFSQTAEYALRAAVHLAAHADRPQTNQQIADATRVPAGYLSKVLQTLGRAGLVRAQRGVGGGFVLSRDAETLTVLDVINAVDPLQRIAQCPLESKVHSGNLCLLERKLDDAMAIVVEVLRSTTLAHMIQTPAKAALCVASPVPEPSA